MSRRIPEAPGGTLNVDDAVNMADSLGTIGEMERRAYGYLIFKLLLALAVFEFFLLTLYAWRTFPGSAVSNAAAASALQADPATQDAWVASIKDLGQIFLISPVFSLIGAVVGYVLGRQQQTSAPA